VAVHQRSISFSRRNPLLTKVRRSSFPSSIPLLDWGEGTKAVTMTIGRHHRLHHGFFSSTRRSSCSSLGMPSSSKLPESSLAFAWGCEGGGLRWWAQLDLIYFVEVAMAAEEQWGCLFRSNMRECYC
jgi:hypothetical protein